MSRGHARAEVANTDLLPDDVVAAHHDVGRLDVQVHEADGVEVRQPHGNLGREGEPLGEPEVVAAVAEPSQAPPQAARLAKLRHKAYGELAVVLHDGEDRQYAAVRCCSHARHLRDEGGHATEALLLAHLDRDEAVTKMARNLQAIIKGGMRSRS